MTTIVQNKIKNYTNWLINDIGCTNHVVAASGSNYVEFATTYTHNAKIRVSDHLTSKKGYICIVLNPLNDSSIVSFRNFVWSGDIEASKTIVYTLIMANGMFDACVEQPKVKTVIDTSNSTVSKSSAAIKTAINNTNLSYEENKIDELANSCWGVDLKYIAVELAKVSSQIAIQVYECIENNINNSRICKAKELLKIAEANNEVHIANILKSVIDLNTLFVDASKNLTSICKDKDLIFNLYKFIEESTDKIGASTLMYAFVQTLKSKNIVDDSIFKSIFGELLVYKNADYSNLESYSYSGPYTNIIEEIIKWTVAYYINGQEIQIEEDTIDNLEQNSDVYSILYDERVVNNVSPMYRYIAKEILDGKPNALEDVKNVLNNIISKSKVISRKMITDLYARYCYLDTVKNGIGQYVFKRPTLFKSITTYLLDNYFKNESLIKEFIENNKQLILEGDSKSASNSRLISLWDSFKNKLSLNSEIKEIKLVQEVSQVQKDIPEIPEQEVQEVNEESQEVDQETINQVNELMKIKETEDKIKKLNVFHSLKASIREDVLRLCKEYPSKYEELVQLLNQIKQMGYGSSKCKLKIIAFEEYCKQTKK